MDSNPTADSDSAKPMRVDNLKMIGGIGPGIENRLHRAGILTFEQLAARTPEEIGALVAGVIGLTPEHIRDMNWIGKAQDLAARQAKSDRPADDAAANGRQHYASFTMELFWTKPILCAARASCTCRPDTRTPGRAGTGPACWTA